MKEMVIKGSVWNRADKGPYYVPYLLNDKGMRCCIGIHAEFCGIPDDLVLDRGMPHTIPDEFITECYMPWVDPAGNSHASLPSESALQATKINDDYGINDEQKIEELRPIFEEIGVEIVWEPEL